MKRLRNLLIIIATCATASITGVGAAERELAKKWLSDLSATEREVAASVADNNAAALRRHSEVALELMSQAEHLDLPFYSIGCGLAAGRLSNIAFQRATARTPSDEQAYLLSIRQYLHEIALCELDIGTTTLRHLKAD